ncbi:hypothetical protein F5883DRAFT_431912 [Diaporthe sp. PMI_573]|nr:hypothetical protein F5883DRAFT_431912 [Diaporthaceae sp. PMI_573]
MSCRQINEQGHAKLARRASFLQPYLRCMHKYPQELMDLTPLEERAISINTPFGFITKLRMDLQWVGTKYRKHIKGHICVFPSNIDDLTTSVLPRTLQSTLENFLITWSGKQEPSDNGQQWVVRVPLEPCLAFGGKSKLESEIATMQ